MNRLLMPKPKLKSPGSALMLDSLPRVVGTLTSSIPARLPTRAADRPCNIVEIRLDKMPRQKDWLNRAKMIEASGLPVILTIRLSAEGGGWHARDQDRLELFEQALEHLSAVD